MCRRRGRRRERRLYVTCGAIGRPVQYESPSELVRVVDYSDVCNGPNIGQWPGAKRGLLHAARLGGECRGRSLTWVIFGSVPSPNFWVRVRFTEPVEGPDPYAPRRTMDDRHEFKCRWLRHDGAETLFGIEDEVVERWLTEYIQMIEWRVDEVTSPQGNYKVPSLAMGPSPAKGSSPAKGPSPAKGSSLAERRLAAGASRLGEPWTDEEDTQLREEHSSGMSLGEMANVHDRNVGGIRSRLIRFGLDSGSQTSSGGQ